MVERETYIDASVTRNPSFPTAPVKHLLGRLGAALDIVVLQNPDRGTLHVVIVILAVSQRPEKGGKADETQRQRHGNEIKTSTVMSLAHAQGPHQTLPLPIREHRRDNVRATR
jgi:hypothetical protein